MKKAPLIFFSVIILAMCSFGFQHPVMRAISFVPVPGPKVDAGQTFTGEISDGQCAGNGSHAAVMKKNSVNSAVNCVRGCAGKHGLVLVDASRKTVYKLDNVRKALPFAGQQANVTGTLDKASETIHVVSIAAK